MGILTRIFSQLEQDDKNPKMGLSRTSLHAKMFVFDRQYTFVGSLNLDPRSVTENTEIGSIIDSDVVGKEVAGDIISKAPDMVFTVSQDKMGRIRWDGFEDGKPVRYTKDPHKAGYDIAKNRRIPDVEPIPVAALWLHHGAAAVLIRGHRDSRLHCNGS
jgi:hypothetical protein